MNNWLSKSFGYPLLLSLYGEKTLARLRELEKLQWLSRERLKEFQLKKLRNIFIHAGKNVPYYKNTFMEYGLNPNDIKDFSDIEKYPVLDKIKFRENYRDLSADPLPKRYEKRVTSGTSGVPLHFIKDRHATSYMHAIDFRSIRWTGLDYGMKQARFWFSSVNSLSAYREKLSDFILNRKRYPALTLSNEIFTQYYEHMTRYKPDYIYGYASAIYEFASFVQKNGLSPIQSIKAVITTSEMLYDYQRTIIQDAFKCRCVNEYGCTEVGVIAFQCEKENLHIMDDCLYVEFNQDGAKTQPMQTGNIILTELHNFSMPFLRYTVGDMGSYSPDPCECGRGLSVMASIEGRQSNYFQTPDGRLASDNIFDFIAKSEEVNTFEVVRERMDRLSIRIVPENNIISDELFEEFRRKLQPLLGEGVEIELKTVTAIKRDKSGKRHYFHSLV